MWRVEGQLPCVSPVIDTVADYASERLASIKELDEAANVFIPGEGQVFGIMIHHWVYRDAVEINDLLAWVKSVRDRFGLLPIPVSQLMRTFS